MCVHHLVSRGLWMSWLLKPATGSWLTSISDCLCCLFLCKMDRVASSLPMIARWCFLNDMRVLRYWTARFHSQHSAAARWQCKRARGSCDADNLRHLFPSDGDWWYTEFMRWVWARHRVTLPTARVMHASMLHYDYMCLVSNDPIVFKCDTCVRVSGELNQYCSCGVLVEGTKVSLRS